MAYTKTYSTDDETEERIDDLMKFYMSYSRSSVIRFAIKLLWEQLCPGGEPKKLDAIGNYHRIKQRGNI